MTEDDIIIHHNEECWGLVDTIVIEQGNALCKVSYEYDNPEVAWLYSVSVVPSMRQKGLGKRLLNLAISLAVKNGIKELYLSATPGGWIKKWYIREGFKILGHSDDWKYIILKKEL